MEGVAYRRKRQNSHQKLYSYVRKAGAQNELRLVEMSKTKQHKKTDFQVHWKQRQRECSSVARGKV